MRSRPALVGALTAMFLAGCSVEDGQTTAVSADIAATTQAEISTGRPVPLPFENLFPNRWNAANDGSPFEPCIAYSDVELARFEIDPSEIKDAAIVDGQGIRGCSWLMEDRFSLSSLVTNSSSLEVYRRGTSENDWQPNLEIDGRTVGLFSLVHGTSEECSTYVQSYSAAVVVNVVPSTSSEGKSIDTCKLAVDFTRAYIDKIPG